MCFIPLRPGVGADAQLSTPYIDARGICVMGGGGLLDFKAGVGGILGNHPINNREGGAHESAADSEILLDQAMPLFHHPTTTTPHFQPPFKQLPLLRSSRFPLFQLQVASIGIKKRPDRGEIPAEALLWGQGTGSERRRLSSPSCLARWRKCFVSAALPSPAPRGVGGSLPRFSPFLLAVMSEKDFVGKGKAAGWAEETRSPCWLLPLAEKTSVSQSLARPAQPRERHQRGKSKLPAECPLVAI